MKDHVLRRFSALCAAFVMLFSSIPVPAVAEGAGSTAPVCGLEEHWHTEECRQEDVLTCGKEEHVHTDACYSAPEPEPAPETNEEPESHAEEEPAAEPEQPSESAAPEVHAQPAEPAEPEEPQTPAQPLEPETPAEPAEPETPAQPEEPEEPETPEEPAELTETEEPGEPAEPAETEAPAESDEPEAGETPGAPTETEKPKETTEPEKTKAPEPTPEEKEEPVHFESGYVLIKSKTTAYTDIYQTAEKGTFIGYATAWAVSAQKAENPEQDWLQVTFDTESAKAAGSGLLTGYIQASSVNALTEEEAQQLAAELEADPTVRKTGTHPLPVVGFELKEEPAAELTVEEVADPIAEPAEVPAETPEEETEQEPDEDPAEEPAGEPEEGPADDPEGEQTGEPAEEPEGTPENGTGESGEETEENPEDGTEESGEEMEEGPEGEDEEPGEETEENPEEETEDDNGEETEVDTEEETEEETEEPTEVSLSSEDAPYKVVLSFLSDAGIPEGTELVVTEADGENAAPAADSIAPQKNAKKSMKMLSGSRNAKAAAAEPRVSIPSMVSWSDGEEAPELILYRKTMDISLYADGAEIEPEEGAAVTVAVTLPGIEAGQDVEVVHMTKDGPVTLESTNDGGTVTFVTDSFSLFTFTSRARQIASMQTGLAETNFYGKTADRTIEAGTVALTDVTEGLEVLETCALPQDADLWTVLRMTGVPELEKAESLSLYAVDGNALGGIVQENLAPYWNLRFNLGELNSWALVKDTGYRHLEMDLEHVVLDGMMPKNASAAAEDVTDAYPADPAEGKTIAAYDISILDGGEKVQPEKGPITVTIRDEEIALAQAEGRTLGLMHIRDDGTAEEITNFRIEGDAIIFEATGFSVYTVIDHEDGTVVTPRVEFHFISEDNYVEHASGSNVYYEGERYWFRNKSADTNQNSQTTQILKNGESLELITDPPNEPVLVNGSESYKYFYGWYVVNPHPISGTTDAYGIGTSDSKLYYEWPLNPSAITFESPISISVDNSGENPVVSWSLNGVSGTGTPDKDGTLHVFLAPVFDKYNFVNFMLYAKNTAGISEMDRHNLMARKLIVMGSVGYAEVKVSDIHATSRDPVHLIFMGWEYEDDSSPTGWTQILTIDSSGHELSDPGKDGVYLTILDDPNAGSIDLYPIFVEARWVDFNVGPSGCGASYVASEYLESWGPAMPEGSVEDVHSLNCFTSLNKTVRKGYDFDGWYAFANVDRNGNITNLTTPEEVTISFVDVNDKYSLKTVKVNTTAIQVGNAEANGEDTVTICNCGTIGITETGGGRGILNTDGSGQKLFSCVGGKLKFYDALDRLTLTAKWAPSVSRITIVYWTEDAQDENYRPPQNPGDMEELKTYYTSNAVRTVTTTQLNDDPDILQRYGQDYFHSGSEIKRDEHLSLYTDTEFGVKLISNEILDDVGAVTKRADGDTIHAREEIFYQLNYQLSDTNKIINGDGETIFNLYFERKTFKLVFHIGRDGYLKSAGRQRQSTADGNWIQYMYKDDWVNTTLGYTAPASGVSDSYKGYASMTFNGRTYDSSYVTDSMNVLARYVPGDNENDQKLYIIEAKYGADISDRWPSPANPNFSFSTSVTGKNLMPYIWTSYYETLYTKNANDRPTTGGNTNGTNPDINGIYRYMSAELCSNRTGDACVENQVHHLVAWFGPSTNNKRFKRYHFLYEAIEGTYDPSQVTLVSGDDYATLTLTTWSQENTAGDMREIRGHTFYEASDEALISNLEPQFQLASDIDGYDVVYSCYNPTQKPIDPAHPNGNKEYDIYFFYRPRQYTLTFMYENENDRQTDTYYYTQSLTDANKYPVPEKEGYEFIGWYTNEAGVGEPFDFEHATMPNSSVVLYPVMKVLRYLVKIDPNGGVIDHIDYGSSYASGLPGQGHKTSQSTYFNGTYGTPIGEYTVTRNYILLSAKELNPGDPNFYRGDKYYYVNMQAHPERTAEWGDWGLHSDLRDAVYLKCNADTLQNDSGEIRAFYNYYEQLSRQSAQDPKGYTHVEPLQWTDFLAAYVSGPYRPVDGEHYTFMGWYEVKDGRVSSMPFNFNDPVTGELELRAKWRLDGGYYIQYNPYFFTNDGQGGTVAIIGEIEQWTDPAHPTQQLYADQSPTQILRAPTNVFASDTEHTWVFRGWRVVRANGTITFGSDTYTDWTPIEIVDGNPVYYQPGDHFIVDSDLATGTAPSGHSGHIIYMQAYYEPEELSERRPEITNLILDSNDDYLGYVNTTDFSALPDLDHPGMSTIKTDGELYKGHPTQILFGDIQSNLAVHLFRYATTKTNADSVTGTNFFSHEDNFKLIGFDENADPGDYIPAYAADSVIAVTRDDHITLYAMWEPMVYVTFVNDTGGLISIALSGTDTDTVSIVNEVTGEFSRQPASANIDLEAGESVKIALPKADVTQNAADTITATVTNKHLRRKMSVSGEYPAGAAYGTGSTDVKYGSPVTYSGTLVIDPDGIVVTYTEEPDAQVIYDVNGGTWTDNDPDHHYQHLSGHIYNLDISHISNNKYEPTEPTPPDGLMFLGWTTCPEIAAITDFSSADSLTVNGEMVTIPEGSNQLDVVKNNYLWDFSRDASELYNNDKTLYAVWSVPVTVTFNIGYTSNMSKLHTWTGPATTAVPGTRVFYRENTTSPYITFTMAKGDLVQVPEDPTANGDTNGWYFVKWLKYNSNTNQYRYTTKQPIEDNFNIYAFDFSQRIMADCEVSTCWTTRATQTFTFLVENEVVSGDPNEEFIYTIAVPSVQFVAKKNGNNTVLPPDDDKVWGSVSTTLKSGEQYTVRVTVFTMTDGWTGYNVVVDVIDRDGVIVKNGRLMMRTGQSKPGFTSDYKYTLVISQTPKTGYDTAVAIKTGSQYGTVEDPLITNDKNNEVYSFTFDSSMFNSRSVTGSLYRLYSETFIPEKNVYSSSTAPDEERLTNGLTVKFTNTGASIVAPTGFTSMTRAFVLMLLTGHLLLAGFAVPGCLRKRRRAREDIGTEGRIPDPETPQPGPRPKLLIQPRGPSGKRGGSG